MDSSTLQYYNAGTLSDQLSDSEDNYNESSSEEQDEELDEEEMERCKCEYVNQMVDLERQFEVIKHQLLRERLTQAERKLEEVRAGSSEDYLQPLQELQENMRIRNEVAGILREFRLNNIRCQHEAEKVAAKQNFESEQNLLKEQLRVEVEEKLRRLEEDRNTVDSGLWSDLPMAAAGAGGKKKRLAAANSAPNNFTNPFECGFFRDQLMLPDRRKKPVSLSGPFLVYMLRDSEILEDWTQIKRAIKNPGTISYC